jgi:outer membrane protein OmpA-like peptidoglycan-associated protein
MKSKKNIIILAVALHIGTLPVFAQHRHEFSVWTGGGVSSLQTDLNIGDLRMEAGGLAGAGYNYSLDRNWSLGSGLEFALLNARFTSPMLTDSYIFADKASDLYRVEATGYDYREKLRLQYLQVPLMVRYRKPFSNTYHWYVSAGPKVGIALPSRYRYSGILKTRGWDVSIDGTPIGDSYYQIPQYGFGEYPESSGSGSLKPGLNLMASLEAGIKWKLKRENFSLYSGFYVDYGLKNIRSGNGNHVFQYNPSSVSACPYDFYSIFTSVRTDKETPYAQKVSTLACGIKIQLSFGKNPLDKKVKPATLPPTEKPYEGLTADQMEDILNRNTALLIEEQRKAFEDLKKLIEQDDPDLTVPVYGFDFNRDEVLSLMHPDLNRKIDLLKKYPKAKVLLEGHTDDSGSNTYNYDLGLERAKAVKTYLVRHGIAANRLSVSSKGKTEPAIPNADEASKRYNRRVEFILQN